MAEELLKLLERAAASPSTSLGELTGIDAASEAVDSDDEPFGGGFQF
jgi:hypothetical protein